MKYKCSIIERIDWGEKEAKHLSASTVIAHLFFRHIPKYTNIDFQTKKNKEELIAYSKRKKPIVLDN